jgi:hypothetical protein
MATQVSLNDGAIASAGALAIQTNGTTQAVSISTGQVATVAQNPILTSGTANGVAFLNGSKVLTTGSALAFDGTTFSSSGRTTINSPVSSEGRLAVRQNSDANQFFGLVVESNAVPNVLAVGYDGTYFSISTSFNGAGAYKPIRITSAANDNVIFNTNGTSKFLTTLSVGSATPSTSGAGITFPATQSASTDANTLDDYEEGTWTATDLSGASLSFSSTTCRYTKVGRLVTLQIDNLGWPVTANTNATEIGGLPFAAGTSAGAGGLTNYTGSTVQIIILGGASAIRLYNTPSANTRTTNAQMSTNGMYFSITYSV